MKTPSQQDNIYQKLTGKFAKNESVRSQLPGRENGPADAYRHILWAADLTFQLNKTSAKRITNFKESQIQHLVDTGSFEYSKKETQAKNMDLHNNEIGFKIGLKARSRQDILKLTREAINDALAEKENRFGKVQWLKESLWKTHPKYINTELEIEIPVQDTNWIKNPKNKGKINWKDFPEEQSLPQTKIPIKIPGILNSENNTRLQTLLKRKGPNLLKQALGLNKLAEELKENHNAPAEIQQKKAEQAIANATPPENRPAEIKSTYYIWRTVNDSKTRQSHKKRNGKKFRWDSPPEGGHPGQDYGCRCYAEPVLEE